MIGVSTSHRTAPNNTAITAIQTRPLSSWYANESPRNRSAEMAIENSNDRFHLVADRAIEKFARWTSRILSVTVASSVETSAIASSRGYHADYARPRPEADQLQTGESW